MSTNHTAPAALTNTGLFMKKDIYKQATPEQKAKMQDVLKTIKAGNIYAGIDHVSASGMSWRISFYRVTKEKRIENVTYIIGWLTGWVKIGEYSSRGHYMIDRGLHVGGCGMDMIFHTLYTAIGYGQGAEKWNQNYNFLYSVK